MTTQVHDIGEQFETEVLRGVQALPTTVDVLLYHDGEVSGDTTAGDNLSSTSDIADITTEPDGASYARVTVNLDGTDTGSGTDANTDWYMEIVATVQYDLSDSTNPSQFDAYGVVVNWDATDDGTANASDHLWWTDTLDQAYTISEHDTFEVDQARLAHSGQTAP